MVEVPHARIERQKSEKPSESASSDEANAEYLAGTILIVAIAHVRNISGIWGMSLSDCNALPEVPQIVKSRPADFSHDGMRAWVL